jgi:predicted nucleic acid-binding Zn ribbon protein
MRETCSDSETERAPLVMPGRRVLASPRPCPVCGQAMTGRKTSACSDRCRAALSRRKRTEGLTRRDRCVRELLEAALRVLTEVRRTATRT